jgi:methylglutamate dehydrogenase subunit B
MRIDCPHCGERNASEFLFKGDASVKRPQTPDPDAFFDFVYIRQNVAGLMQEFWFHSGGCQSWLIVTRDTVTHRIMNVEAARASLSARKGRQP